MATVVTHTIRPPHPGSLIVPYSSPLPTHPPRLSFIPTSTYGCSGSTVVTDARAHGLVVVTLVCTVFDKGLGLNRTINGIGKESLPETDPVGIVGKRSAVEVVQAARQGLGEPSRGLCMLEGGNFGFDFSIRLRCLGGIR